ncbi:MAG: TfpX/TfpZ family type IV pilin accessory protein [Rudaea sp.]
MTRWKAAAIHVSISAVIGVIAAILLFGVWYPPPYFRASGAGELILLLVGVDLCIGPLLTLIIFKRGKRGLKFDLAVIGLVQTIALLYGMNVIVESRPVFLVGVVDRFVLVSADEIYDADLVKGRESRFRTRSWTGPRLVAAVLPKDTKELNDLTFSATPDHDIQDMPKYYRDFSEGSHALLVNAKPLQVLRTKRASDPQALKAIAGGIAATNREESTLGWVPIQARKSDMVMLIDAQTAQPIKAIAVNPW